MLQAYREHIDERAAQGVPPKPLDAQQTAELVELVKNPPAGEESYLLELLTQQVPAGVDEAAYVKAGFLAAVAGLIQTSRLDSATPTAGFGYELDSIAAVVIGGTSLSGGRGSILGTIIGCLIIGVLNNGLILLQVSPFWQQVVKGLVILLAVAIDKLNTRGE